MKHIQDSVPRREDVCQQHGPYAAVFIAPQTWTKCPMCAEAMTAQSCEALAAAGRRAAIVAMLRRAGIPEKFRTAKVEDGQRAIWLAAAMHGASQGPLVLCGTPGTGKTTQACALLKRWINGTSRAGLYATAAEYAAEVRSSWHGRSELTEIETIRKFATAPLLVLDDIGAGATKDMEIVQTLIDARYKSTVMRCSILVTNTGPTKFDQSFGVRMADRIREGATLVEMVGKSYREPLKSDKGQPK